MTGLGPLLGKELREQWRTKRLLAVLIVFALFGLASPLLAKYTPDLIRALASDQLAGAIPPPTTADAVDQFLKNVGQTGVLAAILLAMGSVALDKERGIAALFLTKPASRAAYLLAKLAAIAVTLLVGTLAATAAGYAYTAWLFETLPAGGYLSMGLLLFVQLLSYASLTFLGSTLARSSLVAGAFGIAALAVIAVVGALPGIGPYTPGGLSASGRELAMGLQPEQLGGPLLVNLAVIAAVFGVAWLAFRRQEL